MTKVANDKVARNKEVRGVVAGKRWPWAEGFNAQTKCR